MGSRYASTSNNARELLLHYDGVINHLKIHENNSRAMKLLDNLEKNRLDVQLDASFMFILWNAFIASLWTLVAKPVVQREADELFQENKRKLFLLKSDPVNNSLTWVRIEAEKLTNKLKESKYEVLISKFEELWNITPVCDQEVAMFRFKAAITNVQ